MRSATGLLLFVLICYIAVLNYSIATLLYKRFFTQYVEKYPALAWARARPARSHPREPSWATLHEIARNTTPPCESNLHVAIVVTASSQKTSNDMSLQTALATRLRSLTRGEDAHIWIVAGIETFHPVHRTLCKSFPACRLLVTPSTQQHEVFAALAAARPCMASVVVLEDTVRVDSSFLQRVRATDPARVTCLAVGGTPASCPALAFRLPRAFLTAHHARTIDILPTAHLMELAAPPTPVVSPRAR